MGKPTAAQEATTLVARSLALRDTEEKAEVMLFGTLTVVFDIVQVTYFRLPYIVSCTVIAVFSLIAYAFRAALAPIKMLITAPCRDPKQGIYNLSASSIGCRSH